MLSRLALLIAGGIFTAIFLILALQNMQDCDLATFASHSQISVGLMLLGSVLSGAALTGGVWYYRTHGVQTEKRQLQWDKEDAKLQAEVSAVVKVWVVKK